MDPVPHDLIQYILHGAVALGGIPIIGVIGKAVTKLFKEWHDLKVEVAELRGQIGSRKK